MMRRQKCVMTWVKMVAVCAPLILVVSCAGDPDTVPLQVSPWEELTQPLGLQQNKQELEAQNTGALGNTAWVVTSMNPKPRRDYKSMVFKFQSDGNLVETTVASDGSAKNRTFPYSVVGTTLIIVQQKGDVNARFKIQGNDVLVIDTGDTSILLKRMK